MVFVFSCFGIFGIFWFCWFVVSGVLRWFGLILVIDVYLDFQGLCGYEFTFG